MLIYRVLAVVLLILLTVLLLWYVVRLARKRAAAQPVAAAQETQRRGLASLRWSFGSASANIESNLASRWRRYRIPWIMLLGEPGAGKSTLIENSGIDRVFQDAGGSKQHTGVGWNYFNRGVVLDVAGEYVGAGAAEGIQAWQTVLHLTEKYRPQRPIDGVVVAISASDLLAAQRSSTEELAHKGEVMHRRLWQAQSRFGVRFPVYVVVTQCDNIVGFSSFARALPDHLLNGMLGWSNPYNFETGYQSDWAGQGISSIAQDIFATQSELLAAGVDADDPDAFVLFPSALAATQEALRAYLDQLFRPSAYHETFYFRGIYLTGDAGPTAKAESYFEPVLPSASAPPSAAEDRIEPTMLRAGAARRPVFIRDLFEQKVFAEFGLARTSREALATRNRKVRFLRWATVVLGIGWFFTLVLAVFQLNSKVDKFQSALEIMVNATKERAALHARKESLPVDWYLRNTNVLLEKMAPLGNVQLWWYTMPGSWPWITSLHDDIRAVLYKGFHDIVFSAVRKGLNTKIAELTGVERHSITTELTVPDECAQSPADAQGAPAATVVIEELPEFVRLQARIQEIKALESNLGLFATMKKGDGRMRDLRDLLRYTWRIELPESLEQEGYQSAAIRQQFTFKEKNPVEVFPKAAACAVSQRLDRVYDQFFARNPMLALSQSIARRISDLTGQSHRAGQREASYVELLNQIDTLDRLLKNPRALWLASGEQGLGTAFVELQNQIRTTSALGPAVSDQSRMKAQSEIETLRNNIAQVKVDEIGAIVIRAPEGSWALSPILSSLSPSLAAMFKQRFMAEIEGRTLDTRIDPWTLVRWDVKRLDEAIALAEEQRRYLKDNLNKFPEALQDEVHEVADLHLARRMTDLIAKSASVVADAPKSRDGAIGAEASVSAHDFDRAGPQLVRILAILKEIGADSSYNQLASLMRQDAMRGLRGINRALDASELYSVRDGNFSWWQGTKNPAAGAFRLADAQELAEFLGQQYGQVEWFAKLSAPLLAVVDSSGMQLDADAARVVRRLRAIVREVERFKNKNPRSSVSTLEAFIRMELAEIDGHNCMDKLAPRLGAVRDADYFLEQQITMRHQLYARCVELVTAEATKAYAAIEEGFGRTLAGRFPFSPQLERRPGGEADPEDVVQFLRLYDRHVKSVLPILGARMPSPGATANAGRFLDQMNRVREFLGPLVPPDDGAPAAGYDLAIEFRVNQKAEVDGNKILDWRLAVGDQVVKLRDANPQLRWRPGLPITLTLHWAKDAPTKPVNDGALSYLSLDDTNVSYRFADPWALVSMLKMHAAAPVDAVSRAEVRPHTLKFEFATQPVSAAGQYRSSLPESRARVFIRLTVTPSGKKVILSLPVFPYQVPGLSPGPAAGPQRLGAQSGRPEARSGWPDAYPRIRSKALPALKAGVPRQTGESRD